jgi:AraC-like DNA-binding protein
MEDPRHTLLRQFLAYAVQRDIPLERLAALSSLDPDRLRQPSEADVPPKQWEDLWRNAVHLSKDPLFGLHLGESLQGAALGVVGQLVQACRNVGEALTQAAAFSHQVTDLFRLEITRPGTRFTIRFVPDPDRARESPFVFGQMMDLFMAFTLHEADGLVLEKLKPLAVALPHAAGHAGEYERVLRCKPVAGAEAYSLTFEGRYWQEPILTANYGLQSLLLQQAGAAGDPFARPRLLKDRLLRYLLSNAYLGLPSLEAVAANFALSPRSLQRKLQEEGVSYQQLVDEARKSLALQYLASGQYPLKEIAYILGYNEISAFSRAFKRWTGAAPMHYQSA